MRGSGGLRVLVSVCSDVTDLIGGDERDKSGFRGRGRGGGGGGGPSVLIRGQCRVEQVGL